MRKITASLLLGILVFYSSAYCRDIEAVKLNFLKGDYKAAILEGEKILAGSKDFTGCDELYYFMGLSYLKDGNALRATDIFEIIINEFPDSRFREPSKTSLGDAYLSLGDLGAAEKAYKSLLNDNPSVKSRPALYYRLAQLGFKKGDNALAKEYLDKLKKEYPLSPEARADNELLSSAGVYYTVQVGSFSSSSNAGNLMQKLIREGYPAYVEELRESLKVSYRVRVGKFNKREEALELEKKLSQQGYPTRISP